MNQPQDIEPSSTARQLDLASRQFGLVTTKQLTDLGTGRGHVARRVENQRLLRVCPGVHVVGRPISSRNSLYMAALLAAGPGAFLTDRSAADLWGFRSYDGPIEVVRGESRKPPRFWLERPGVLRPKAVKVRRSRHLSGIDVSERFGLPVLGPERTLLNLAAVLTVEDFEATFKEADRLVPLSESALIDCATRNSGWKGLRRFRMMVLKRHPHSREARSLLEVLFLEICRDFELGDPVVNVPEGRYVPDFRWPEIGLIVEVDGYENHKGRLAFLQDSRRENELRAAGNQVIRFTWEDVTERPEGVASLVRQEKERLQRQSPEAGLGAI